MKRLKDFKITERIPRSAVKVVSMQFGDDEATRCIILNHTRRESLQPKGEIQNLTYK